MPSVLLELGYVSNKEDLKLLISESLAVQDGRIGGAGGRCVLRQAGGAGGTAGEVTELASRLYKP